MYRIPDCDVVNAMSQDAKTEIQELRVDGGPTRNQYLMQFQSDISDCTIRRPVIRETTAARRMLSCGLATGVWHSREELKQALAV